MRPLLAKRLHKGCMTRRLCVCGFGVRVLGLEWRVLGLLKTGISSGLGL